MVQEELDESFNSNIESGCSQLVAKISKPPKTLAKRRWRMWISDTPLSVFEFKLFSVFNITTFEKCLSKNRPTCNTNHRKWSKQNEENVSSLIGAL